MSIAKETIYKKCSVEDCTKPQKARGICSMHWWRKRYHNDLNHSAHKPKRGDITRYFNESVMLETDACVEWPYHRTPGGYGRMNVGNKKLMLVHRLALIKREGEPTNSKYMALHKPLICNNPACFNYRHLYWGTQKENMQDAVRDGSVRQGERVHFSKLKPHQVHSIRNDKRIHRVIAEEYNVSRQTIDLIINRSIWKSLKEQTNE